MPAVQEAQTEFARFLSMKFRALVSYRSDGRILIQRIGDSGFRPFLRKKSDVPLEQWIANKRTEISAVPAWCFEVHEVPSLEELEDWNADGICETPTGYVVEPDGQGPDDSPSWLRCLGLI